MSITSRREAESEANSKPLIYRFGGLALCKLSDSRSPGNGHQRQREASLDKYRTAEARTAKAGKRGSGSTIFAGPITARRGDSQMTLYGIGRSFRYPIFFGVCCFSAHADDSALNHLRASK